MLIKLARTYLAPYRQPLLLVVLLQFVGTLGALYLPKLNADIIDKGVITGDTGYIMRTGAVMLAVAFVQIVCSIGAVWYGARTAMSFGRDVRAAIFRRVGSFSQREVQDFGAPSLITRETNDVQQVQMLVLMSCTLMVMAPIMMVGGIVMAMHVDVGPLLADRRHGAGPGGRDGPDHHADGAQLPADADPHRRGEPPAARADHRRARGPRLRARAPRDRALRDGQRRAHRRRHPRRPLPGRDVPDGDAGGQRGLGRRAVVRRPSGRLRRHAGRRADGVPRLPHADRDVGDDGHVHDDDAAQGGGLRRPGAGGAGHRDLGAATGRPGDRPPAARHPRARRRRAHLPGRGRAGAARRHLPRRAGADRGGDRLHRRRQVHVGQPGPSTLRRHRRRAAGRRRRRTPPRARAAVVGHRARAPARVPVLRHRPVQPAARQARRHRRRAVVGVGDRAGSRLRARDARGARCADRPGRHQRQRRPAATAGHRARGGEAGRRSTCSTTRSPRSTWPPTPGCAPRCGRSPATRRC